jgi:hypothetical protein
VIERSDEQIEGVVDVVRKSESARKLGLALGRLRQPDRECPDGDDAAL